MEERMAFMKVARVSDVPPGHVKVVEAGYEDVALCNVALCNVDGQIYAVADVCTHDDGPLGEGCLHGDQIECPRHGARFDVRTGAALSLPAVVAVPIFEVRVEGDDILVDVEA
jgi:3-phenylpropionate/trans-cinnamate dioxygenase ferredoxin subunit